MKQKIAFSIIIPVYNESQRLYKLNDIFSFLKKTKKNFEVIVVNDGSTDNTLLDLKTLQRKLNYKLLTYKVNRGKGFAIKTGVLQSQGKHILFSDIDLSTPISEFQKFLPFLGKFDLVIGTRKKRGAKLLERQPLIRELMGKGFTILSQMILQLPYSDFTCGFKCFSKTTAYNIFSRTKINRWGFDSEVLLIAHVLGYKIKEIPVTWQNDLKTKVKFPQDIICSLAELIKIRINYLNGLYR